MPVAEEGASSSPQAGSQTVSLAPEAVKVMTVFQSTVLIVYRDSSISAKVKPAPRSTPRL